MDLSLVIPIYNEEESIAAFYQEVHSVMQGMGRSYEIIFVDDGSSDTSLDILKSIQVRDKHLVLVSFRRNFGQTAAMSAGFDQAKGDIIITLDGDMQNDPHNIPEMIAKLDEGYDIVSGWRHNRQDAFLSRKLPSMIANWLISTITNVKLHDYGCTLKVFRKEVAKNIRLYGEMHRFIPAIASGHGARLAEMKVNHRERRFGTSKYNISRTIRVILDLITVKFLLSYATRPIQIFGLVGFACSSVGFLIGLYLTFQKFVFGIALANRPLLLLGVLLIFLGIQFITIGLLAELQARTYHEAQNKPIYAVRQVWKSENR